jgi:hypothetical protein
MQDLSVSDIRFSRRRMISNAIPRSPLIHTSPGKALFDQVSEAYARRYGFSSGGYLSDCTQQIPWSQTCRRKTWFVQNRGYMLYHHKCNDTFQCCLSRFQNPCVLR